MKVRVGSQGGINRLEDRLTQVAEEYAASKRWKKKTKALFLARMAEVRRRAFEVIRAGVEVSGQPWDETLKDEGFQPKDRALLATLRATQEDVHDMIERVARHRNQTPAKLAGLVALGGQARMESVEARGIERGQALLDADSAPKTLAASGADSGGAAAVDAGPSAVVWDQVRANVQHIAALAETMPSLARQLEELNAIRQDQLRLAKNPTERTIQSTDATSGAGAGGAGQAGASAGPAVLPPLATALGFGTSAPQ
eukprot:m.184586 g.184586  ORF g.184586 m.184586 type:complete len:256 (-) comp18101_c2_seq3:1318-2085(-)